MSKNIHEAINEIMKEVGYVRKERVANLNYSFAGEAALIAAVRPAMLEQLVYMHVLKINGLKRENYITAKGTSMTNTLIDATVRFMHAPSGTFVDVAVTGEGSDAGDKSANKALTGLYKYAIRQTFCIETGDDPDKQASEERMPSIETTNILSPKAVEYASKEWNMATSEAKVQIEEAIRNSQLHIVMPKDEFKKFVKEGL